MTQITHKEILEKVLRTIVEIGAKTTSEGYILLAIDTLITKLKSSCEAFNHVRIKTTNYSSATLAVSVDYSVNDLSDAQIGDCINALLGEFTAGFEKEPTDFMIQLKGFLGRPVELRLNAMGVNFE